MPSGEWREGTGFTSGTFATLSASKGGSGVEVCVRGIRGADVLVGDDHALDGLGPAAVFVDAGMGFDGADDAVSRGLYGFGLLDDEFEAAACSRGALLVEAKGAGVAVDDAAVGKLEFIGNGGGTLPMKETLFNGVAFGMAADGAMSFVMGETDGRFGFVAAAYRVGLVRREGGGWEGLGS